MFLASLPVIVLFAGGCEDRTLAQSERVQALLVASEAEEEPIRAVTLTTAGHNEFTDDVAIEVRDQPDGRSVEAAEFPDASNIAVGEFTVQPGAWFPWHTHPGAGMVAVAEGDLVFIYSDECTERPYNEGEAFVDPGVVHTAYNPSDTEETVVIATFVGVPTGAELATPVDPEEATVHNEECDTDAPIPNR